MFYNTIKKSVLTTLALCITFACFSQTSLQREYLYDDGGNRICRKVLEIPANTLRNLRQQTEETPASYFQEQVCSYSCKIYPNPTSGQIQLDIEDLAEPFQGIADLYNSNGVLLRNFRITESHSIFDLSDFPPGMYILRLNINNKREEWKIVKR